MLLLGPFFWVCSWEVEKKRGDLGESWVPGERLCLCCRGYEYGELEASHLESGGQIALFFRGPVFLKEIENIFRVQATWGEVWENEKYSGNTSRQVSVLFQQLFPVYESFYNSNERQKTFSHCFAKHRVKITEPTVYFEYQNVTSPCSSLHYVHSKNWCQVQIK